MSPSLLLLLLVAGLSGPLAAPPAPAPNQFLEGLDDFLEAFDGLALPGDPVAESSAPGDPVTESSAPGDPVAESSAPGDPQEAQQQPTPPSDQQESQVVTEVAPCLGCVEELDVVGADLQRVARLAAGLLEEELNMTQVTEVTQVYWAARQVVNGIKFFLTLELVPTNCSRPLGEGDVCVADPEAGGPPLFSVEILEHPQQELAAELLLWDEVAPEEVADLPGLLVADAESTSPPPTGPPSSASAEGQPPSFEDDLLSMIGDVERLGGP